MGGGGMECERRSEIKTALKREDVMKLLVKQKIQTNYCKYNCDKLKIYKFFGGPRKLSRMA